MECEFCEEDIAEGALACPRCGSPISKPAAKEPADTQPAPKPEVPPVKSPAPWDIQVPAQPAPPARPAADARKQGMPPASEEQAPAPTPATPPDVPLAKEEIDFIAMAEETIIPEGTTAPEEPPLETPAPNNSAPAVADGGEPEVPPGAGIYADRVPLDDNLIGGYKGGAAASSVAGAGEQTADDPFGLRITEVPPPLEGEEDEGRGFNFSAFYNVMIIIAAVLVAGAVAVTGIYFGFLREKTPTTANPVSVVKEYCGQVISGDTTRLNNVSVPGSSFQKELGEIIKPYEELGVLTMKDLAATATSVTDTQATVQINRFVVNMVSTGSSELIDLLSITKPAPLRTTINLVKQNGKWLVSN